LKPARNAGSWPSSAGGTVAVPAGGAAYLASAIASLRAKNPNHAVVSAGDMIGASPLVSALFLDEPTIEAVNVMKIDFNAVGNHEFDKGQTELLRMKNGGCAKNTALEPCQVNKAFPGANFGFLAANTVKPDGSTLFPATGMKTFTQGRRDGEGRLHRHDAQRHAEHRHAVGRGRLDVQGRGRHGQRADPRPEARKART
jgi:5'-nucleotidase